MPIVAYASIIGPRYEETRFMEASPVKGESDEAATAVTVMMARRDGLLPALGMPQGHFGRVAKASAC